MGVARTDVAMAAVFCVLLPLVLDQSGIMPREQSQPLSDPAVQQPQMQDIVSARALFAFVLILPVGVFLLLETRSGALRTALAPFLLGLVEAAGVTLVVTDVLKLLVGRPRPYFAAACLAYVEGSTTRCTGDAATVAEARKSFPSGHASMSFATMMYLAMYAALAVGLGAATRSPQRAQPICWKLLVVVTPPFLACLIAVSRVIDNHHHYSDIVAGALLGGAVAYPVAYNRMPDILAARSDVQAKYEPLPM